MKTTANAIIPSSKRFSAHAHKLRTVTLLFMLRLKNCAQVVQVCNNGETRLCGKAQDNIAIIENGGVVVDRHGNIEAVDTEANIEAKYANVPFDKVVDCAGKSVLPGFIDGHTHPGLSLTVFFVEGLQTIAVAD